MYSVEHNGFDSFLLLVHNALLRCILSLPISISCAAATGCAPLLHATLADPLDPQITLLPLWS